MNSPSTALNYYLALVTDRLPLRVLLIFPLIIQVLGILFTAIYIFAIQGADPTRRALILLCLVVVLGAMLSSLLISRYVSLQNIELKKQAADLALLNSQLAAEGQWRELIEGNLRESKALFQDVLNNAIASIACFRLYPQDYTRKFIYLSEGQKQVFGYTTQQFREDISLFYNNIHPEDRANIFSAIDERVCQEGEITVTYRFYDPGGKMRWIYDHLLSRWDAEHGCWFVTAVGIDITPQKEVETALKESEVLFRSAFTTSAVGMNICSLEGQFLEVNSAFCEMLGYTAEELLCLSFPYLTHPEDLAADQNCFAKLLAGEIPSYSIEKRYFHKQGNIIWTLLSVALVRDQDNQPLYTVAHIQNITKNKQAETDLLEQRNFFQQVLNTVPNPIFVKDKQGYFIMVNQAAADLEGIPPEEMIGRSYEEINFNIQQVEEFLTDNLAVLDEGKTKIFPAQKFTNLQGKIFFLYTVISPFMDSQGQIQGIVGACTDITELKAIEANLLQAKEAAEAANHAKSTFLTHMSHELRTPLNAILGFSKIMQYQPNLTVTQQENLEIIISSGEHLLALINEVLDLSKIEAGKVTFQGQHFDLYHLLGEVMEIFRLRARQQGLKIYCDRTPDVPQYIYTDEVKLRQVLLNLVGNALKFTPSGSISIKVELLESSLPHTSDLEMLTLGFSVTDTGVGITSEEFDQLFQPFSQTSSGRNIPEGTGLGLSICKRLVQLLGGDIQLQSQLGQGTTISFQITARRGYLARIAAAEVESPREAQDQNNWQDSHPTDPTLLAIDPADLAAIPIPWLENLSSALVTGDLQVINALIKELYQIQPKLVPIFSELINQYKFESILSLVQTLINSD